jgi:hypothetical protein
MERGPGSPTRRGPSQGCRQCGTQAPVECGDPGDAYAAAVLDHDQDVEPAQEETGRRGRSRRRRFVWSGSVARSGRTALERGRCPQPSGSSAPSTLRPGGRVRPARRGCRGSRALGLGVKTLIQVGRARRGEGSMSRCAGFSGRCNRRCDHRAGELAIDCRSPEVGYSVACGCSNLGHRPEPRRPVDSPSGPAARARPVDDLAAVARGGVAARAGSAGRRYRAVAGDDD